MRRRTLLKWFLGLGVLLILISGLGYRDRRELYRRYLKLRLEESSDKGTLSEDEFQIVRAVFDVISPKPAPSADELRQFVDWRTSSINGYYREYLNAVALLESGARKQFGKNFAGLEEESREKILKDVLPAHTLLPIQDAEPQGLVQKFQVAFETVFFRARARFKYFVFWDLLMFYWSSSAGWSALGYNSYPGVPDPLRTYASAPDGVPGGLL